MTRFSLAIGAVAVAVTVLASQVQAQGVTQQASVEGASGQQTYSVRVTGANGVSYNCRPDIQTINGVPTRFCRPAAGGAISLQSGSLNAPSIGGLLGAIAIAIVSEGDSGTTTTTN